jgi:hypothetical protein
VREHDVCDRDGEPRPRDHLHAAVRVTEQVADARLPYLVELVELRDVVGDRVPAGAIARRSRSASSSDRIEFRGRLLDQPSVIGVHAPVSSPAVKTSSAVHDRPKLPREIGSFPQTAYVRGAMSTTSPRQSTLNSATTAVRSRITRETLVGKVLGAAVLGLALTAGTRLAAIALAPDLAALDQFAWLPVVVSVLVASIGAGLAYAAVDRLTSTPRRAFLAVSAVVLALSMVPVVLGADAFGFDATAQLGLAAMHVAAAVGIVGGVLVLD